MARQRYARPVREKSIEDACRKIAERNGGQLYKTTVIGFPGFPDRLALFPRRGRSFFVEFKRPGEKPTELQQHWHDHLRMSGQEVHVIDNSADFEKLL